jgi:cytochrome c peroxidase
MKEARLIALAVAFVDASRNGYGDHDHMTSGNLGLTDKEESQIVAFLQTLSDGFTRPYLNSDTYSGSCMRGGAAATQGNDLLIPTPTLPRCASAICGVAPVPSTPIP